MNKVKTLLKNVGILTIGNFSTKLISFFLVPLYTSILSTTNYGIYDVIQTTIGIIIPVITLNIIDGIVVFSLKTGRNEEIGNIVFKYFCMSMVPLVALLALNWVFNFANSRQYTLFIFLLVVFQEARTLLQEFAKSDDKYNLIAISGFVSSIVAILCNILFLIVLRLDISSLFLASVISNFIVDVYLLVSLKKKFKFRFYNDAELERSILKYSLPLIATTIGWIVNSAADKYVVAFLYGFAANGLLSVAYKLPSVINIMHGIFGNAWQVTALKEYNENGENRFISRLYFVLNMGLCIVCSGLIMLTRLIAQFMFAKDFFEAWKLVPFLVISSMFNFVAGYLGPIYGAMLNSKMIAKSVLYGAILNVIFNIGFAMAFGIQGIPIATMLSSFFIFAYRKNGLREILDYKNKAIYISWIILYIQSTAVIYVNNMLINILFFAGIAVFYLFNSRELIQEYVRKPRLK